MAWEGGTVSFGHSTGLAIKHANGNTEVRMFHVLRRDESTPQAIVLRHIRPDTEIWTDEWQWRAYTNIPRWVLNGQPYVHGTVNHQQNFVNPITGANTQMIERAGRSARLKIIKNANNVHPNSDPRRVAWTYTTPHRVQDYIRRGIMSTPRVFNVVLSVGGL